MSNFYKNKIVLITGHTGFKGTGLCRMLLQEGAIVIGYSIDVPTSPSLGELTRTKLEPNMIDIAGDILDIDYLDSIVKKYKPEIIFHLAAQPIVRESYDYPRETYLANTVGTLNLLEVIRKNDNIKSVVIITTDKVYENNETNVPFKEDDKLNGFDPYSNSKSCAELIASSYKKCFLQNVPISTVRAGNVIGGGDFGKDRIIPDILKHINLKEELVIRQPNSIRPYQHVLEALSAYMMIAEKQYQDSKYQGEYNIGPDENDCIKTIDLVQKFKNYYSNLSITINENNIKHEASYLRLNTNKIKRTFYGSPKGNINNAVEEIINFYNVFCNHPKDIKLYIDNIIKKYKEQQ